MKSENTETLVANFIKKTYDILENQTNHHIISWLPSGKEFTIKNIDALEEQILPIYFRHRNIHSFIRQLNMYNFHKSRKDPSKNIFSRENFQRGKEDLLALVRRKIKSEEKNKENQTFSESQPIIFKKVVLYQEPDKSIQMQKIESCVELELEKKELSDKYEMIPQSSAKQLSLQSMICPSSVLNGNPEMYSNLHENGENISDQSEDNLSIEGEIQKEREVFRNRTSGVSLILTQNLLGTHNNLSNPDI